MIKVKGFGYDTEKDKNVIEHIQKQPHQANYIWSLVRQDMNKESIEEIVRKQIEKYLENMNLTKKEETVSIDTEEVLNILNL